MKRNLFVRMLALLLVALALFSGCSPLAQATKNKPTEPTAAEITEDGEYSSKDEVAEYLQLSAIFRQITSPNPRPRTWVG